MVHLKPYLSSFDGCESNIHSLGFILVSTEAWGKLLGGSAERGGVGWWRRLRCDEKAPELQLHWERLLTYSAVQLLFFRPGSRPFLGIDGSICCVSKFSIMRFNTEWYGCLFVYLKCVSCNVLQSDPSFPPRISVTDTWTKWHIWTASVQTVHTFVHWNHLFWMA